MFRLSPCASTMCSAFVWMTRAMCTGVGSKQKHLIPILVQRHQFDSLHDGAWNLPLGTSAIHLWKHNGRESYLCSPWARHDLATAGSLRNCLLEHQNRHSRKCQLCSASSATTSSLILAHLPAAKTLCSWRNESKLNWPRH